VVGAKASGALADDLRAARSSEARLLERIAELEVELSRKQHDADTGAAEHRGKLEAELLQRDASIADLQAQLTASASREARMREEVGEHSANLASELTAQKRESAELAEQNRELSERAARLEGEAQAAQARIEHQAMELAAERQKLAEAETAFARLRADDETPKELAALEAALRERGEHIRSLQDQLREAERVGRELLRELGRGPGAGASAAEQLAAENARLTANLEALSWSVQELEGRLSAAGAAPR
jgi:chromosome segregation ATPase